MSPAAFFLFGGEDEDMSSRPFLADNPSDIQVGFTRSGEISVQPRSQKIWETPPKVNHLLWCECFKDARWYLHLDKLAGEVPPLPTLDTLLRGYEKLDDEGVAEYLRTHGLSEDCLDHEIVDPLWDLTWETRYSPLSLAYDFLWDLDIPNKPGLGNRLLFEEADGLLMMPRQVSTEDILCLKELQAELYERGVALVVAG